MCFVGLQFKIIGFSRYKVPFTREVVRKFLFLSQKKSEAPINQI